MKIGIDKIGFYTSNMYVDMTELANARNEDPNKYLIGIGQEKMAVIPPTQDAVTLGANAAFKILTEEDKKTIDLVIFATEAGIDNSKSGAVYVSRLLGLSPYLRAVELKQACYGATAALQLAKGHVALNPDNKALVIGSDIARYGLRTKGEPTQGGGACAMIVGQNPRILELEETSACYMEDVMDFWRPFNHTEALVNGKFSANIYVDFFKKVFSIYREKTGAKLEDFSALLFHLPYTKQGLKGLRAAIEGADPKISLELSRQFEFSRKYGRLVGNLYTGSLYLSLLSLLNNSDSLRANQRLGMFSYGSGAQGEFFTGRLVPGFEKMLDKTGYEEMLEKREKISVSEYEKVFSSLEMRAENLELNIDDDPAVFVFAGIEEYSRKYLKK